MREPRASYGLASDESARRRDLLALKTRAERSVTDGTAAAVVCGEPFVLTLQAGVTPPRPDAEDGPNPYAL